MHDMPSNWVATFFHDLGPPDRGVALSYQVNLFGEILEVKNHFFELPESARLLIMGKRQEESIQTREAFEIIRLKYMLPMIALGYYPVDASQLDYRKWISSVWRTLLETRSFPDHSDYVSCPVALGLYRLEEEDPAHPVFQLLEQLLFGTGDLSHVLNRLIHYPFSFLEPLFFGLLKRDNDHGEPAIIIELLANLGTTTARDYLMDQLALPKESRLHELILEKIQQLDLQGRTDDLVAYYHAYKGVMSPMKCKKLLINMINNPSAAVKPILYRELQQSNSEIHYVAFWGLRLLGEPHLQIAKTLENIIRSEGDPDLLKQTLSAYSSFEALESQLTVAECLGLFRRLEATGPDQAWQKDLGKIMRRLPPGLVLTQLKEEWKTLSPVNKAPYLDLIRAINIKALVPLVLDALESLDPFLKIEALETIADLADDHAIPEVIPRLLTFRTSNSSGLREVALLTLCRVLQRTPEERALDWLVRELPQGKPITQRAIISVLPAYQDERFIPLMRELYDNLELDPLVRSKAGDGVLELEVIKRASEIRQRLEQLPNDLLLEAAMEDYQPENYLEMRAFWKNFDYLLERLPDKRYELLQMAEIKHSRSWIGLNVYETFRYKPGGMVILGLIQRKEAIRFAWHNRDFGGESFMLID
ncbi:HEAT repeat domain-containing protein [Flavilitoribacter nigricans]|uniref:HEAT repeat domain-containing protein n=1 Tax=Flavilitoribacter nigricans (strain ATCC 23147 / DSM 23189 / NBRC 102662 / NCIMB 1420 / SS-2) TaxID=1122177 RepID=A0A2D0N2L0_FLAN2|nr:hypothetical protein [Flavilitoribacter nigricans]PHN02628.1 hypothetical protein CRP01_31025 [Flavilitoribacter nigricans DSM 23189 = NBRC 102662]